MNKKLTTSPSSGRRFSEAGDSNKPFEKTTQKRNQMLMALHQVTLEMGTELQLSILLKSILHHAQSLLVADRGGGIYLLDAGKDVIRLAYGSGINQGRDGVAVPIDHGVAGHVYRTAQPLVIDDYTHWDEHATVLVADPPSTVMGVPLFLKGEVIGILVLIANSRLRKFSQQDVQQAEMFAAQAAVALRNAQLYQQAQQEITERKLVEVSLATSEDKFKYVFDNSVVGKSITLPTGEIQVNHAFCELLGYSQEELQRKKWQDISHPDDIEITQAEVSALLAGEKEAARFNKRYLRKDDSVVWTEVSTSLRRDQEGKPLYFMTTIVDITDRKRVEQQLEHYAKKLEEMVEERTCELHEIQEKLVRQEKLAILGQFAGGVGHELRNPLAVIKNAVYYLKNIQPDANEKVTEYLRIIDTEAQSAAKIITDLLDFSRIKSVDPEPFPVSAWVQQTLDRYPTPSTVILALDLPLDLPLVYADLKQMVEVLGNLILNAYQAMTAGGKLSVSAHFNQGLVAIAVSDTGTGISPENMSKLFEPLFTTKAKGIGLGLVVSQKLVEANHGRIEVCSQTGKGTTFTIYLPVEE